VFSGLCQIASRSLVGNDGFKNANYQVFRSLDHGTVYNRCRDAQPESARFPSEIREFAAAFIHLKEKRELADYCPDSCFDRRNAEDLLARAEAALKAINSAEDDHKRAFALFVLIKSGSSNKKRKLDA